MKSPSRLSSVALLIAAAAVSLPWIVVLQKADKLTQHQSDKVQHPLSGSGSLISGSVRSPRPVPPPRATQVVTRPSRTPVTVVPAVLLEDANFAAEEAALAAQASHEAALCQLEPAKRRGAPAARTIYGNAASVFAGDWLLIEALRRVRGARVPGTLDRLLEIIDEMQQVDTDRVDRPHTDVVIESVTIEES